MKSNFKKLGAGMLALAVVGSVSGLLTMSLAGTPTMSPDSTQPMTLVSTRPAPAMEAALGQTAIETIVVHGHMPTNFAGLVTRQKHNGSAGPEFASAQRRGSNSVVLK